MKILTAAALAFVVAAVADSAAAFSCVTPRTLGRTGSTQQSTSRRTTFVPPSYTTRRWLALQSDVATALPDGVSVYDQLGIEEGKLALGVKPAELLKYVGTRELLIEKTLEDIPSFDRAKAEAEIDKFLMDAEMLNMYIQFGKELEKDPDFKIPDTDNEEEGFFSFRTLVFAYLGFLAASSGSDAFRSWVADQQIANTWTGTNIPFIDDWIEQTSPEATARALKRLADAAAEGAAQTVSDAALQSKNTLLSLVDAVQHGGFHF